MFLDTDALGLSLESGLAHGKENEKKGRGDIGNETEVRLVSRIVRALDGACGVKLKDIGVISHYRAQVTRRLKKNAYLKMANEQGLEINTIDTYQGRDKKVSVRGAKDRGGGEVTSWEEIFTCNGNSLRSVANTVPRRRRRSSWFPSSAATRRAT